MLCSRPPSSVSTLVCRYLVSNVSLILCDKIFISMSPDINIASVAVHDGMDNWDWQQVHTYLENVMSVTYQ